MTGKAGIRRCGERLIEQSAAAEPFEDIRRLVVMIALHTLNRYVLKFRRQLIPEAVRFITNSINKTAGQPRDAAARLFYLHYFKMDGIFPDSLFLLCKYGLPAQMEAGNTS
jgi:hypothetical protein